MNKDKKHSGLVPELRFPEFIEEWEEKEIKRACEKPFSGGTPSSTNSTYYGGEIPFIRSAEIDKEKTELFLTQLGYDNSSAKMVNKGDVLIALYGANSGDVAISKINGAINQAILCLRSKTSNSFLHQYLIHKKNWIISRYLQGGQGNLSGEIIKSVELFFPKENEQQKIANTLTSLDDLIGAEKEKLNTLKAHKKGLLQQLFPAKGETVPKVRFGEFEGAWEIKNLSSIAKNLSNKRVPITSNVREKGDIPYYGATGVIDYVKDYIFNENLLLISEDGANLIDRNYPIAFSICGKTWVNNHAHVLKPTSECIQILVEKYINSISIEDYLTGQAQPKLNKANLNKIPIPLPKNPKEQKKIANCLSSLDDTIAAQSEKIKALQAHKKGLMQQLFP